MPLILARYPKMLLLACSFVLAYGLYHLGYFGIFESGFLSGHGYISAFIGGLLFSFGFTSPFGIALFASLAPHVHPVPAAIVGGFGSFLMDLAIFELLRFSTFHDELHRLRETRWFAGLHRLLHHESISHRIRMYLLWSFAGIIIASPLPDELGVSLVSSTTDINGKTFGILCFVMNTLGILFILLVSR